MKTMTIESENPDLANADLPSSLLDLDPDHVVIEASGGPIDGGGGAHSGPTPPPEC